MSESLVIAAVLGTAVVLLLTGNLWAVAMFLAWGCILFGWLAMRP